MSGEPIVILLGRRDEPTDGVRDYCSLLSQALARRGKNVRTAEARWDAEGWLKAIRGVWEESRSWTGTWVLFQYTALMWSRRGFPLGVLVMLWILKFHRVRVCIVFHDISVTLGSSLKQQSRIAFQHFVMRTALRCSARSILTVPPEQVPWFPAEAKNATFIPVGSNFPQIQREDKEESENFVPTIAVFGISGGEAGAAEIEDIAYVMKELRSKGILPRLKALGRGCAEAEQALRKALDGTGVELSMPGLMAAADLANALASADVLLCVRGHVSTRRGSAIAGIVCGLPIVGYRGQETAPPITDAGVLLAEMRDREELVRNLARVLTDRDVQLNLKDRSAYAAKQYFGWHSIAARFDEVLFPR